MPLEQPPLDISHGDKLLHALAYLSLAILLERASPNHFWPLGAVMLIAYSGIIELVQQQSGYRSGDWADMLANSTGVALGLIVRPLVHKLASNGTRS